MCGIAAIVAFSEKGKERLSRIRQCPAMLQHRGPDNQQFLLEENFAFAHARLSIIDLSAQSNQPFHSGDQRFTIIFNGELFNYRQLREELRQHGCRFETDGDVEVLVNLYRTYGADGLNRINGFFAFVLYDWEQKKFFAARDRYGVKPFYFHYNNDYFACASELRTLRSITDNAGVNEAALLAYLQLTYVPEAACMLEGVEKLEPGECITINGEIINRKKYYELQLHATKKYEDPAKELLTLLTDAVKQRLVADVPVASFLSGGIDSSVITALASQQKADLKTFSIGFAGNEHFDESRYAEIVAKKYKTQHETFHLTKAEAEEEIENFLDSIDEPFADSSAFNLYVLSKKTRQEVKVVLSGDGADELFAGYNKHRAEWMIRNEKLKSAVLSGAGLIARAFPSSRNSSLANKLRQLVRFSEGARLSHPERFWRWASFYREADAKKLLVSAKKHNEPFQQLKNRYTSFVNDDLNSVLIADMRLVLPSDMLVKVDRMSMAHALEVRNPFLDYRVVEFAFSLSPKFKIDGSVQKKLLKESCAHLLPPEIINRKKHGFETPVQQWLSGVLKRRVDELLLDQNFIREQQLFNYDELKRVTQKALSHNAGESASVVWALLIFNHWYKKHFP